MYFLKLGFNQLKTEQGMELQGKEEKMDEKNTGYNSTSQSIVCFMFCHIEWLSLTQHHSKIRGLIIIHWNFVHVMCLNFV